MINVAWYPPRTGQARPEQQSTAVGLDALATFLVVLIEQGATIVEVR